ncbi:MAG: SynChlorMet cassette protein ScmC [Desulfobacteraceae bacterium IS3]|nr:MAG: SynChlorMet cassette protein ScmC [Desulfobacteraceae bacterium IS3]
MEKKHIPEKKKAYSLSLCDGAQWQIRGQGDISEWIDRLASIIEIKPCHSTEVGNRLLFAFGEINEDAVADFTQWGYVPLEKNGWRSLRYQSLRFWYHKDFADVLCEVRNKNKYVSNPHYDHRYATMSGFLHPICYESIRRKGLPLHTGMIERYGQAVLLAGSGGTGKSTACRRFPASQGKALCDDGTLVLRDQNGVFRAHPLPTWSDFSMRRQEKTWNMEYSVPVSAIFILEKAPSEEVIPVGEGHAAILINQSSAQSGGAFWHAWDKAEQMKIRQLVFRNACEMAKAIPVFRLRLTLHGNFWEYIEKAMGW